MSNRLVRRIAATLVVLLGAINVALALAPHHHIQLRHQWFGLLAEAVGGPRYLRLVAALALFAAAPGLLRARRSSWWVAIAAAAASALGHHFHGHQMIGEITSLCVGACLIFFRSRFRGQHDPQQAARGIRLLLVGELGVLIYGILGLYLVDFEFVERTTLGKSVREALRLLVLLPSTLSPVSPHGAWLLDSVRLMSLIVVLGGLARILAPAINRPTRRVSERDRVMRILESRANTPLAWFHLADDKSWFFSSDREAVVTYRLVGRVAMVLGAPVGYARSCALAVSEFLEHCDTNGWIPAFYQVTDSHRSLLEPAGLKFLKVGEEAVIVLDGFNLVGGKMKEIRSAMRRVERAGGRVEVLAQPIDEPTMAELAAVSDAWLASGHRERAFTVGQFSPEQLRQTTVFAVRDGSGRIVAFANALPAFGSKEGTFDLMRRRPGTVNGVMDYLHVALFRHFAQQGLTRVNLGMAALANLEGSGVPQRALRAVRDFAGGAFKFSGLYQYKRKWNPRWEARYVAYLSDLDLPSVAVAITRVGELSPPARSSERVKALAMRFPFTSAMMALTLWLCTMVWTDPAIRVFLVHHFGLSWPDLTHFRWWRLATSPVMPPPDGISWSPFIFAASMVPLAEWRFGSSRTVKAFFLGDWLSTLPTLGVLRIAALAGSHAALALTLQPDTGASSGGYGLAAALAASIPNRRWRFWALGVLFASALLPMVLFTRIFEFQHLIAATVGIVLGTRWARPHSGDAAAGRHTTPNGKRREALSEA
jgi:phosphatidylglycerol lysyltransferase